MSSIDSKQYKLLTKLKRNDLSADSLSQIESEDCLYLVQCGYATPAKDRVMCNTPGGSRRLLITTCYKITPSGRAARYEFKATFYKWWIPVVISILAIVISLAALLVDISELQPIRILENLETLNGKPIFFLGYFC